MAIQLSIFDRHDSLEKLSRLGDPLVEIARVVPFEMFREDLPSRPPSPKGGRREIDPVRMFKLLVIQHLYRLSDEQLEYQTLDRASFQRFVGIERARDVPDFTTVWRFRERLGAEGAKRVFDKFETYLCSMGLRAEGGQILDASIVQIGKPHKRQDADAPPTKQQEAHTDKDADFTKKYGRSYRGYKQHVNVDQRHRMIRSVVVTAASAYDGHVLPDLITRKHAGQNKSVFADSAYLSGDNDAHLKQLGLRPRMMNKRKAGRDLTQRDRNANRARAKVRATVEHAFAHQNGCRPGGRWLQVVGLVRASTKLVLDALVHNARRLGTLTRSITPLQESYA